MGLLDRPTQGTVWIQGQNTSQLSNKEITRFRGHTIGFIFQFHHLLPAFTALENVMIPALADQSQSSEYIREQAMHLLHQVGLADKAHSKATEISGGQQQRVAIARALAMNPVLVLADEPTGNLDTHTSHEVFDLLRRINQEQGTSFLVVTHDVRLAEQCDRVIELVDGTIRSDSRRQY
jgi:lipoprotein-releasing system ATP-binding protein